MCRSETCSLARLGSPWPALAEDFPALPITTTAATIAATKATPMTMGKRFLFSSSRAGENGCCSESPMREILLPAGLLLHFCRCAPNRHRAPPIAGAYYCTRSEEHTSELQSHSFIS